MSVRPGNRGIRAVVIGAGLMGARRAFSLAQLPDVAVHWICDPDAGRGNNLAARVSEVQDAPCRWLPSQNLVDRSAEVVDLAVVAVPHDLAASIACDFLDSGIHTFVEKPMGRDLGEASRLVTAAESSKATLAVGFNYRHYPAVQHAKALINQGYLGSIRLTRMIMGHGARPGYEQEWKAQRLHSGGGVLLDPGIHLIDLARFLVGAMTPVQALTARVFWPLDVEDVAQVVLRSESEALVSIQTSLVDWRNRFSVELIGDEGYVKIDGRMGTYGPQTLTMGKRWAWLKCGSQVESETTEYFGDRDTSYDVEISTLVAALKHGESLPADHQDGLAAMRLVSELYTLAGSSVVP